MKTFNYSKFKDYMWDSEILGILQPSIKKLGNKNYI